jgi:NADH:ubiquinone oxidoreductase subunit F (NADH-binding)
MAQREHFIVPPSPYPSYAAYQQATGEGALGKARAMQPEAIIEELSRAGLRGRGGAGFPTGAKWRSVARHPCPTRYAVCNAAEGEPGTFKDRHLLRRDPYAMLEGLLIAAHVVGAEHAYVAAKRSFTRELERIRAAIVEMTQAGALADVVVEVVEGPEEYLFGEEKALLEVIEGNDPLPREPHYPPYERGLFATALSPNPAAVNNVETLARVPGILRAGAESFRALGTADTPGPLIFTVSGDVKRPGVYELEAGITLRALFHEIAGGPRTGRKFKAALSGVSTAVIAADRFDVHADHASLQLLGAGLGSAGFVVLDDSRSIPRIAQTVARFLYVESCNQCAACKHGLRTASSAIDELFDPEKATPDDVERALYGARHAPQGNRCYLPVQGATLISSLLTRYDDEFQAQLADPTSAAAWLIPKLVDFDESKREFTYDESQPRKRPNWTYEPAPAPTKEAAKAPSPARPIPAPSAPAAARAPLSTPAVPIAVRLMPDVRERLARAVRDAGEIDAVVNAALREWLDERGA